LFGHFTDEVASNREKGQPMPKLQPYHFEYLRHEDDMFFLARPTMPMRFR
jgi:hypothetical protein